MTIFMPKKYSNYGFRWREVLMIIMVGFVVTHCESNWILKNIKKEI